MAYGSMPLLVASQGCVRQPFQHIFFEVRFRERQGSRRLIELIVYQPPNWSSPHGNLLRTCVTGGNASQAHSYAYMPPGPMTSTTAPAARRSVSLSSGV